MGREDRRQTPLKEVSSQLRGGKDGARGMVKGGSERGQERTSNFLGGGVRSMPKGWVEREKVVPTKLNNIDGQRKLKAVKVFSVAV